MTTVIHIRDAKDEGNWPTDKEFAEAYHADLLGVDDWKLGKTTEVYIGRPSIWGNPFIIGRDGSREEVIAKYEDWVTSNEELINKLEFLRGKALVCYCKPKACHGDVLARLADNPYTDEQREQALRILDSICERR